jgi:FKBP-type peptidyl-prolyl cis-trans isomerase 2
LIPSDAYGQHDSSLIEIVPRKTLPTKKEFEIGTLLILRNEEGTEIPAKVIDLNDEDVTIDLNHPLAGITLNYRITLIEVVKQD